MSAGKGDRDRVSNIQRYKSNYDLINFNKDKKELCSVCNLDYVINGHKVCIDCLEAVSQTDSPQ